MAAEWLRGDSDADSGGVLRASVGFGRLSESVVEERMISSVKAVEARLQTLEAELREFQHSKELVLTLQKEVHVLQEEVGALRALKERVESHMHASPSSSDSEAWDKVTVGVFGVDIKDAEGGWEHVKRSLGNVANLGTDCVVEIGPLGLPRRGTNGVLKQDLKVRLAAPSQAKQVLVHKAQLRGSPYNWNVCEYLPPSLQVVRKERVALVKELRKLDGDDVWYDVRGTDIFVRYNRVNEQSSVGARFTKVDNIQALKDRLKAGDNKA